MRRYPAPPRPRTSHTSGTFPPPAIPTLLLDSMPSLPQPSDYQRPGCEIVRPPAPRLLPPAFATEFATASGTVAPPPAPQGSATTLPELSLGNWPRLEPV